ncbi:GNAT family N-acetyltransferase [Lederbergia lenta]|uniref:GNAT family N-acetyltransferase n=1 Tax=Lederbergia lenta TaxID=1467 RepID=UPI002041ACC9|nr:GNAT family N-acetyltransferase [Lederbergia lenta]MCM3112655.1 GNAT family N-acetyltransferase [Lederbergia lenta]
MAYSDERILQRIEETHDVELTAIYILPNFQNRKIGSMLLEKGLQELSDARQSGRIYGKLQLHTARMVYSN